MSLGPDLYLDPLTHDLALVDGDMVMTIDVRQAVKIRILFFRGEWFLDTTKGVPYFDEIFVKQVQLDQVRTLFREAIAGTPGVLRVVRLELERDSETRVLTVNWSAQIDAGEISGEETL